METRKVTIINSKTQLQKVIENSTATTLGELKSEMRAAGIDYDGMTFYEGHMRAELKDDAAPLPTNIPYKGTTVNDLIFMLTTPEKKVKSGMITRNEAYAEIKRLGLQDECKRKYGKNFTQCSTDNLVALIESANKKAAKPAKPAAKKEPKNETPTPMAEAPVTPEEAVVIPDSETPTSCGCGCDGVKRALQALADALYNNDVIEQETYNGVNALLNGKEYKAPKKMSQAPKKMSQAPKKMSQGEINEMFSFVKR